MNNQKTKFGTVLNFFGRRSSNSKPMTLTQLAPAQPAAAELPDQTTITTAEREGLTTFARELGQSFDPAKNVADQCFNGLAQVVLQLWTKRRNQTSASLHDLIAKFESGQNSLVAIVADTKREHDDSKEELIKNLTDASIDLRANKRKVDGIPAALAELRELRIEMYGDPDHDVETIKAPKGNWLARFVIGLGREYGWWGAAMLAFSAYDLLLSVNVVESIADAMIAKIVSIGLIILLGFVTHWSAMGIHRKLSYNDAVRALRRNFPKGEDEKTKKPVSVREIGGVDRITIWTATPTFFMVCLFLLGYRWSIISKTHTSSIIFTVILLLSYGAMWLFEIRSKKDMHPLLPVYRKKLARLEWLKSHDPKSMFKDECADSFKSYKGGVLNLERKREAAVQSLKGLQERMKQVRAGFAGLLHGFLAVYLTSVQAFYDKVTSVKPELKSEPGFMLTAPGRMDEVEAFLLTSPPALSDDVNAKVETALAVTFMPTVLSDKIGDIQPILNDIAQKLDAQEAADNPPPQPVAVMPAPVQPDTDVMALIASRIRQHQG